MRPIPPLTLSCSRCSEIYPNCISTTAVKKPPSLSSAQVIRDLQHAFRSSQTFAPLLQHSRKVESQNKQRSKRRRIDNDNAFKMGHGGTLDPLATGVVIVGIGRGTKHLQSFLDCTKTYETVVLFGKSTDTYDIAGKIVASADTSKVDRALVEEKLAAFRGAFKQVPPIYSALKINGMKAYEYARSGKELPRELAAREMNVSECVLTEWYEPGQHDFRWPLEEAAQEEKDMFNKFAHKPDDGPQDGNGHALGDSPAGNDDSFETALETRDVSSEKIAQTQSSGSISREERAAQHTHEISGLSKEPAKAPAARVRLTVSSGFYVRSFAHDLGIACGSYGIMAELARTRQGSYTSVDPPGDDLIPAVDHADFAGGEHIWAPKIANVLGDWVQSNPASAAATTGRERHYENRDGNYRSKHSHAMPNKHHDQNHRRKRQNSSSPE